MQDELFIVNYCVIVYDNFSLSFFLKKKKMLVKGVLANIKISFSFFLILLCCVVLLFDFETRKKKM